jgi:hypothetical protein
MVVRVTIDIATPDYADEMLSDAEIGADPLS